MPENSLDVDVDPTVQQLFDLTGRTALITGGTGWLGTAFSRALAEAGASVVISSRERERARDAAATLPKPKDQPHFGVQLDHMEAGPLEAGFREALEVAGQLDILVNNGLGAVAKDLTDVTLDEFAWQQRNNAGYFALARLLRDHVVERGAAGAVVSIGSMYGQVASYPDAYEGVCVASPVSYHALKGGTIHMTRHLAAYWARDRVRVNCLSPGAFPNPKVSPELVKRLSAKLPMARMGLPYELKGALLLLVSDAGSYITGQNLTVDGGWTAW